VRRDQGDFAGALQAFEQDLAIAEKLAAADPGHAGWQRDLIVSHVRMADMLENEPDRLPAARSHFEAALKVTRQLEAAGRLNPTDSYFADALEQRLAALAR
jgi:hypothetical protein